jgi:hypothetical protein
MWKLFHLKTLYGLLVEKKDIGILNIQKKEFYGGDGYILMIFFN